jgi:hypothetical protein
MSYFPLIPATAGIQLGASGEAKLPVALGDHVLSPQTESGKLVRGRSGIAKDRPLEIALH